HSDHTPAAMNLSNEFVLFADELTGQDWRQVNPLAFTPAQHAAYARWADAHYAADAAGQRRRESDLSRGILDWPWEVIRRDVGEINGVPQKVQECRPRTLTQIRDSGEMTQSLQEWCDAIN